jgi:hypothetical protein
MGWPIREILPHPPLDFSRVRNPVLFHDQANFLSFGDMFHGDGVDAVANTCGRWTIGKDMTEVAFATGTADLGAEHEVRTVDVFGDGICRNGGRERGPTCS